MFVAQTGDMARRLLLVMLIWLSTLTLAPTRPRAEMNSGTPVHSMELGTYSPSSSL